MKDKYKLNEIEDRWRLFWNKEKLYKFDFNSKKEVYSVDTPPPTISGRLHMGHAFGDSQQDFFVRYKRMKGYNVLNPFGTDNNGLPTIKLVEKEKKVSSKHMERKEFIELCNKTIKEEFIPSFIEDAKKLGISADWDIFYSTIDERSRRISQWSFIDLYKKGREYRIDSPSLWCPECQTTLAQVELEDREVSSFFNDIIFKVGNKDVIISTTRPELLPACVAVFVNPKDKRYKSLIGKKAKVPLFDFEVLILKDSEVDMEKGTGMVFCATFGDQQDMKWQKQYNLPIKTAISFDGKMTDVSGKYKDLKIIEARKKIIEDLKRKKLLIKQKKIVHPVNVHERCGTEVEFIKTKQWFIKYLDLKKEMLKWGKEIKWHPSHMRNRYDNWIKGLKWDWCISRQIAFGIPFPVWYCKKCDEVILANEKDLPVDPVSDKPPIKQCPKCKSKEFVPEKDIMNTWATSALTPTIIKDLLKDLTLYKKIKNKPLNIRRNGHDIITFWDFNTIVKSRLHYGVNPWNELLINGWILGSDGKKMSKSRGNGVSPQEIMDEWGADILRFLSASSKLGDDLIFQEKELIAGRKMVIKLINASKFCFSHLKGYKLKKPAVLEPFDEWLLVKLDELINNVNESFDKYEYSRVRLDVEKFFWSVFCDYYLEIVKDRLYNPDRRGMKGKDSAQYVLYKSLLSILKLLAPIMPYITEELYQNYYVKNEKVKSIHISNFPKIEKLKENKLGDEALEVISKVRKFKADNKKSMKEHIKLTLENTKLELFKEDLEAVCNADVFFGKKFKVELK